MEDGNALPTEQNKNGNLVKRLYDWTRHWARTPYGTLALFIISFCEASFFPVPPDVLLLVLTVSKPKRSFYYAFICSLGSILGGCFGFFLGYKFFEHVGLPILKFYGFMDKFENLSVTFNEHGLIAIIIAGITPIPYKVFTIAAGFCGISFTTLLLASVISRPIRFFAEAGLIFAFGEKIESFIEKYFNLLSILFIILLVLGFVAIKFFH